MPTAKELRVSFARKGGNARAKSLTPERRQEIARLALSARWAKYRANEREKLRKQAVK